MTGNTPALLAAAAGVGFGHAILPDHWAPLAVLGRTRRYPLGRVARLSGLAAVTHVLVSIVLGALIIAVGLQFRSAVEGAQDAIIGGLLIATGVGFLALELTGHGHGHVHASGHEHVHASGHEHVHASGHEHFHASAHEHVHPPDHAHADDPGHAHDDGHGLGHHGEGEPPGAHEHGRSGRGGLPDLAAVVVPFGAAASPDLTILPVFLAATTVGVATALGALAVFAAVTVGTIVGLTLAAARGGRQIRSETLDRWGNALTAIVLLAIGALVFTGVI